MNRLAIPSVILAAAAVAALAGCTTVPAEPEQRLPEQTCRAEPAQAFVGQRATAELGAKVQAASGATRLRWLPPRTVTTMEYAYGRVNVRYDDAMTVTGISCG